jgi:hypothetical protein
VTVELKVYTTAGVLQGTVQAALEQVNHELSAPGTATVTVPASLSSLLVTDRVVRVELDGTEVAAGLVRQEDDQADDSGGMRTYSLPGVLHLLGDGLQKWPAGMNDVQEVWYGWAHPDFDATGYSAALSWGTVQSVPLPTPRPAGFPDPLAHLITSVAALGQGPRDDYYFADFTLAAQTRMGFYFGSDDGHQVMLQGALISSVTGPNQGLNYSETIYTLPAGTYRVAGKVRNEDRGTSNVTNATWLTGSGIELDGNDQPTGTVIFRTSTSWVHASDPASPPGQTPGEILRLWLEAAQGRGTTLLDDVTLGFDDADDSDGDAWTAINLPVRVGSSGLNLVQDLAAAGVQVWMDPDLTLQARQGTGPDVTATVTLNRVSGSRPGEQATVIWAWTENGWVEETSGASTRYERFLSLSGWLEGEHKQQTDQALDDWAAGRETATFAIEPGSAAKVPVTDFGLGYLVDGDDMDGVSSDWLVTRMTLERDGEHYVWNVSGVKQ